LSLGTRGKIQEKIMKETYTALIKQMDNWWIGWIEEIPGVNCQEATKEELLESLRLTLQEALEFNRFDARKLAGDSYIVQS
jgi:predicted RNase H-like HicB family nuclease